MYLQNQHLIQIILIFDCVILPYIFPVKLENRANFVINCVFTMSTKGEIKSIRADCYEAILVFAFVNAPKQYKRRFHFDLGFCNTQ